MNEHSVDVNADDFEVLLDQSIDHKVERNEISSTNPVSTSTGTKEEMDITSTPVNDIRSVDEAFKTLKSASKLGVVFSTGAQFSLFGHNEALAYCKHTCVKMNLTPSSRLFRFTNTTFKSLGKLSVRIPVSSNAFIERLLGVVQAEIPFPLGGYILDRECIYLNNIVGELVHYQKGWTLDLVRKFGHIHSLARRNSNHFE